MKFPNNTWLYPRLGSFGCRSMLRSALILILLAVALPAFARPHVSVRHHRLVQVAHEARPSAHLERKSPENSQAGYHSGGVVTVSTAAGPITVASDAAAKFVSLTNDLVAHGFHGSVTCLASGHMPGSLHHTGHACDFAQTARNRTVAVMYHVGDIIAAHGLRDGCSFGDCGHVDTGTPIEGHRFAAASSRHQTVRVAYEDRGRGQSGAASWGATPTTAASFAPSKERYVRAAFRETGRSVVMNFPERAPSARERFIEVKGGATRAFGFVRHGHVRLRSERT